MTPMTAKSTLGSLFGGSRFKFFGGVSQKHNAVGWSTPSGCNGSTSQPNSILGMVFPSGLCSSITYVFVTNIA